MERVTYMSNGTNDMIFDANDPNTPGNIIIAMHNAQGASKQFEHNGVSGGWTGLGVKIYTTDLDAAYDWYIAWNAQSPLYDGSIAEPASKDEFWPGSDGTWNVIED